MMIPQDLMSAMALRMTLPIAELLEAAVTTDHAEVAETIITELGLEEIRELGPFLIALRDLLANPQDLATKVRRQSSQWIKSWQRRVTPLR